MNKIHVRVADWQKDNAEIRRILGGLEELIGMAAGIKRGFDVFVQRLSKEQGDHHGQ